MKGVGGPLLCIGDLLSDLQEQNEELLQQSPSAPLPPQQSSSSIPDSNIHNNLHSLDLTTIFQENYNRLNDTLAGTDHSWIPLTLQLCSAVETANKLVQSTNSNVTLLSEKVEELKNIVKKGDSAVAAVKATLISINQNGGSLSGGRYTV